MSLRTEDYHPGGTLWRYSRSGGKHYGHQQNMFLAGMDGRRGRERGRNGCDKGVLNIEKGRDKETWRLGTCYRLCDTAQTVQRTYLDPSQMKGSTLDPIYTRLIHLFQASLSCLIYSWQNWLKQCTDTKDSGIICIHQMQELKQHTKL